MRFSAPIRLLLLVFSAPAFAQQPPAPAASAPAASSAPAPELQPATALRPLPRAEGAKRLPIVLRAASITSQPDLQTVAEGDVEFRRGGVVIRADRLAYDSPQDLATASGRVRVAVGGAIYSGPELQMSVQRFEGYFLQPQFEFLALGAGGRADRIDFLGGARTRAANASYTSCPRDDPSVEPAWVLRTDRVNIDLDANEGVAEGAVLRFQGVPILALPALSFPLGDGRKSGWLPPSINIDNRSGLQLSVPWYWNIAPNRDATFAPRLITRRGVGLDSEFRYLEPAYSGTVQFDWLPADQVARRSRESLNWQHDGQLGGGWRYGAQLVRVSDNDWWKDFPDANRSFIARLLAARLEVERPFELPGGRGSVYGRGLKWQVLQDADSFIAAPYERSPQVGVQLGSTLPAGFQTTLEAEYNRFTLPHGQAQALQRPEGDRLHLLGALSRPWREPGWWVVPRVALNAASYDGTRQGPAALARATRVIPTYSLDLGLELERRTQIFGRALHQTLEPRLLYVNTPLRDQTGLPNYDAAAKDFNFVSLYTENAFSGVDRVSDAHQVTAGFTTRLVDAQSGAEALRLGVVQRYLLRDQLITPQADGTPGGAPLTQRLSDALLVGSGSVAPGLSLNAAVQYSPDIQRSIRSILGVNYSPGPYRTVGTTYRLARGLSEQIEVGWQWPVWGAVPGERAPARTRGSCGGTWYSVGRFNYSLKDRRLTDSVLGLEYDAGCWIARVVAEQLSTGRSEATTRLLVQLELVGLSRIGSNPLKVLKDNIPGYRLLRDEHGAPSAEDRAVPTFHD
jgi:LPS-assembly protein